MPRPKQKRVLRIGITLIELLVVVTISVLLLATAVPLMKPALQSGKLREASRQLNVFIQIARARAIETGRSAGILIERNGSGSDVGFAVFLAETPAPYQGDTLAATAVSFTAATSGNSNHRDINFDINSATLSYVAAAGDVIKFDYKGNFYPIVVVGAKSGLPYVEVDVTSHALPPTAGMRYQIFRQPRKSIGTPLQFTGNVAIDLEYSGIGQTTTYNGSGNELSGREFRATASTGSTPVVIAFNASGVVDHVTYNGTATSVDGAIHLLVGRSDQVGEVSDNAPNPIPVSAALTSVTQSYSKNAADSACVWVTIQPRTGAVTSAENAWINFDSVTPYQQYDSTNTNPPNLADSLLFARQFAQSAQAVGGN